MPTTGATPTVIAMFTMIESSNMATTPPVIKEPRTSFAPVEDPQIAVAVLVENGGQGGKVAAPLAKRIIEEYLKDDQPAPSGQL